jgi:RNA polymerase sigma-70 factor (ECF subfamily)
MNNINTALLLKFQKGDRKSFKLLFNKYSEALFYYATKFVDDETARDIVQDTFLKIWSNKKINITGSINYYLMKMVRNGCLEHINKSLLLEKYYQKKLLQLKSSEIRFDSDNPMTDILTEEVEEAIKRAIALLPNKTAVVFKLSREKGLKNKEIAKELNISIKTIEKHMTNALKILRVELKGYLEIMILLGIEDIFK